MQAPKEIIHVTDPSTDPQKAQINADIILIQERASQNVLLFSSFILIPSEKRLISILLHILTIKDSANY